MEDMDARDERGRISHNGHGKAANRERYREEAGVSRASGGDIHRSMTEHYGYVNN
jgi:hypothetical protein